jgi:hypothetical protein
MANCFFSLSFAKLISSRFNLFGLTKLATGTKPEQLVAYASA